MTDLNDFQQSIHTMTDEELADLLREIRLTRRTAPTPTTKRVSKAKEPKIDISALSPEFAAKLLQQLGD